MLYKRVPTHKTGVQLFLRYIKSLGLYNQIVCDILLNYFRNFYTCVDLTTKLFYVRLFEILNKNNNYISKDIKYLCSIKRHSITTACQFDKPMVDTYTHLDLFMVIRII